MTGEQSDDTGQTSLDKFLVNSPQKTIKSFQSQRLRTIQIYQLKQLTCHQRRLHLWKTLTQGVKIPQIGYQYPNPPVPSQDGGMVLHNSHLHDLSGISTLFDWISDGDAAIVELGSMISRQSEFDAAIAQLTRFVIEDLGGKILQIGESRIYCYLMDVLVLAARR